jgi:hypothetical protein
MTTDANDIAHNHGPERLRKVFDNAAADRPMNGGGRPTEGLPLRFWKDLGTVTPPDRLVRRLLGTTSFAVLYGEPGCGKSFLATDLGFHVAVGRKWFGRSVTPGAVLYVAGEGVGGLTNRVAAFTIKYKSGEDVPFVVVPQAINLGPDGRDAERVISAAAEVEKKLGKVVQLIVIDTLARSLGGGDENSAQDMGRFIAACDRIRLGTGSAVLVVHHSGKNSKAGARGSSALKGAADTVIEVEKRDAGRVAKVEKQKDGVDGVEIGFDLEIVELGHDEEGEPITSCVVRSQTEVAKAAPKLSKTEKRAMDVLYNALVDFGENAPNSVRFPNVTPVKIERFRQALKSCGVTDRDNPNNERSQWRRITTSLANKGVFVMRDDYCWACDRP